MALAEIKKAPNMRLVEELERILADVKSGKIQALCWISEHDDRTFTWGQTGGNVSKFEVIGQLHQIIYRLHSDGDL